MKNHEYAAGSRWRNLRTGVEYVIVSNDGERIVYTRDDRPGDWVQTVAEFKGAGFVNAD